MSETLQVEDLVFTIKRSGRRKTVGISVERDGSLVVSLPEQVNLDEVVPLIRKKLVWVYQKLQAQNADEKRSIFRKPEFIDGEGFYLLGQHYRLKIIDSTESNEPSPSVWISGDRLLLRRDQLSKAEERIEQFYTRRAHPYLNDAVEKWAKLIGVSPTGYVNVTDLGYRWGSCSANGRLNFHWRVMQLAPALIEYVVVHELAHLKKPDHSPEFWSLLGRAMPDYASRKDLLKKLGGRL